MGFQVDSSQKVTTQVDCVVKKAYDMLAFIGWSIEEKSQELTWQLYRTLVRWHLQYCVQFRSHQYRKDVEGLEGA